MPLDPSVAPGQPLPEPVLLDQPLSPEQVVAVARGAELQLSEAAVQRIRYARRIVEGLVAGSIRGYGINTGVGALCDVIISPEDQSALSRNILFSHACGVGEPLESEGVRAIMATQINNFALGRSGISWEAVETLLALLNAGVTPVVPSRGSVGYLTHTAAIGLVLIGAGEALQGEERMSGAEALRRLGRQPLVPGAKEGLSLVNGTVCGTGLAVLAHARLRDLVEWGDAAGAFTYEVLARQEMTFHGSSQTFRDTPGVRGTAESMQRWLEGMNAPDAGSFSTQDPLSLRAIPQVHGAIRDELDQIGEILTQELRYVSDNPAVAGTPDAPEVYSQANAVGASVGFAGDRLAMIAAQLGAIAERRVDRLVNPLVSGLPAFLGAEAGRGSGFMIAQYTAAGLKGENRMLAFPASLAGGITSALQEDMLTHATPAAEKSLRIIRNTRMILAIELLCGAQARDLARKPCGSQRLRRIYQAVRDVVPLYADDRPLSQDMECVSAMLSQGRPAC
ncbi:HAL/PAL/TAL family ammonia-lyase [Leisingera sp. ANG-Vp]|uniref:HAL/PAL/TAL family ammonia-lyase n=1 Tax=Leisingera sp. ANG-Vp TaxID=1577896 RepID=UPI000AB85FA8|nr:histidine ammonia-lyase [Leisingera sp. ANG-Vp]